MWALLGPNLISLSTPQLHYPFLQSILLQLKHKQKKLTFSLRPDDDGHSKGKLTIIEIANPNPTTMQENHNYFT